MKGSISVLSDRIKNINDQNNDQAIKDMFIIDYRLHNDHRVTHILRKSTI